MSLRQAARLRRARGIDDAGLGLKELPEEKNDNEEESSAEESPRHASSFAFARAAMGWSSESPSEDENDNERGDEEEHHTPTEPCTEDMPPQHHTSERRSKKRGEESKVNMQKKNRIQNTDDEIIDYAIADIEHNDEVKMTIEGGGRLSTVINPLSCLRTDSKVFSSVFLLFNTSYTFTFSPSQFLNVDSELRSRFGRGVLRAGRDEPVHPLHQVTNYR